jgi:hypothetical protein
MVMYSGVEETKHDIEGARDRGERAPSELFRGSVNKYKT